MLSLSYFQQRNLNLQKKDIQKLRIQFRIFSYSYIYLLSLLYFFLAFNFSMRKKIKSFLFFPFILFNIRNFNFLSTDRIKSIASYIVGYQIIFILINHSIKLKAMMIIINTIDIKIQMFQRGRKTYKNAMLVVNRQNQRSQSNI
ncbi:unnamed protein product (macronuclear) [Paramecium tetraurelia]|uniref:Transmembrane protein n=1 Tax=Paramecium tetraurelia TaxID=5888 RepID=A0CL16_PARTE|nr:uncharacterized protein GSPATT00008030001 [Paramecium tetraurelia]CAK71483.1 unnamed protein product [Paramecium tetraurelia]|eukprot:XP_001438880.1 hypothetical protein (macronuclear) [Paramecium tetraurelia strain d4-2]